ncbi:MAG: hypothetical protein AAF799_29010 [Myxococcota bacterium]
MTLSRAKSRPITVDGRRYRYQFSTTKIDGTDEYRINLTIQAEPGDGAVLQVHGLRTRDGWLDHSTGHRGGSDDYPSFTPRHIQWLIERGLEGGWNPDERGRPFRVETTNSEVLGSGE